MIDYILNIISFGYYTYEYETYGEDDINLIEHIEIINAEKENKNNNSINIKNNYDNVISELKEKIKKYYI